MIQISFSATLKDDIFFKLKNCKVKFIIVMEADSLLISIDEKDLPIILKISHMIKSDYLIIDSMNAPISNINQERFFNG